MVDPATPNLNLQITVYDSTSDVSLLTTDRVHILFDFSDPQNVNVVEVFIISNPSKQAVVAPTPDGTVVTFPLPQGYTNLQFQDGGLGDRYVEVSQGFADTSCRPTWCGPVPGHIRLSDAIRSQIELSSSPCSSQPVRSSSWCRIMVSR